MGSPPLEGLSINKAEEMERVTWAPAGKTGLRLLKPRRITCHSLSLLFAGRGGKVNELTQGCDELCWQEESLQRPGVSAPVQGGPSAPLDPEVKSPQELRLIPLSSAA